MNEGQLLSWLLQHTCTFQHLARPCYIPRQQLVLLISNTLVVCRVWPKFFMKTAVSAEIFNVGSLLSALLVANEPLYMPTILERR